MTATKSSFSIKMTFCYVSIPAMGRAAFHRTVVAMAGRPGAPRAEEIKPSRRGSINLLC